MSSALRHIAQASLIYAAGHNDHLPVVRDVWEYAGVLAQETGLNDATLWQPSPDPARDLDSRKFATVLAKTGVETPHTLNPTFRQIKPSFAVPLGIIALNKAPPTTPIAWSRGLRTDGTWAPHSPYGTDGGYIAFASGHVAFFPDVRSPERQLTRYSGEGKTPNIYEALPPGIDIGEYTPTPDEKLSWSNTGVSRSRASSAYYLMVVSMAALLWAPFVILLFRHRTRFRRWRPSILLWPFFLTAFVLPVIKPY